MIKAIIFDFDGVIGDTYQIAFSVFRTFDPDLTEKEFQNFYSGNLTEKLAKLLPPADRKIFFKRLKEKTTKDHVFPIKEILEKLSEKHALFIVSSNSDENIEHHLVLCDLRQYFQRILGATTHGSKLEKFKMIFDSGLKAEECCFITDTVGDIREVKHLDVKTIAVTWGYHDEQMLSQEKPFAIAHNAQELGEIIHSLI